MTDETKPPCGSIQWKGTNVCMDVYCVCGWHSHWDCDFLYALKCPGCDRVWGVCPDVKLTPAVDGYWAENPKEAHKFEDEVEELKEHRQRLGLEVDRSE